MIDGLTRSATPRTENRRTPPPPARTDVGGVASFIGLVRDMAGGAAVGAMALEHYPGMTEKKVAETEAVLETRGDRGRSPKGRVARQRR